MSMRCFGCEDNRFAFPARLLAKPVVRSYASLRERLRAEGTGLEQIRQEVLLDPARELLLPEAGLKLEDVARRLGFADARAFRRAFLAWSGKTPDKWRRAP
jgi:AraC-like DNA-binding protein